MALNLLLFFGARLKAKMQGSLACRERLEKSHRKTPMGEEMCIIVSRGRVIGTTSPAKSQGMAEPGKRASHLAFRE